MSEPTAPQEHELHAWVDGQLPDARRAEIDVWLAAHPNAAAELADWQRQNEAIRAAFAAEAPAAGDASRVAAIARSHRRWWFPLNAGTAAAAALLLFIIGAGTGAIAALALAPRAPEAAQALPAAARDNYLIYTREVRHAVEVGADEEAHLVSWLGKRIGSEFSAPDLTPDGFTLVGGRLVPYEGAPGALLMYEDANGQRLTLLMGRNEKNAETGFLFDRQGAVRTFYWIDGPVGYALSGEIDRDRLERISRLVYRQL